jgi:hypothetical protein
MRSKMVGCWFMTGPTANANANSHEETASSDKVTDQDILRVLNVNSQFPKKKFLSSKTLAGQHDNHTGHTNTPEDTLHTHRLSVTHNNTHRFSHTLVVWCVGRISTLFISLFWKLLNKLQNWKLIENELRRARRRSKFFGLRRWKKFVNKRTNEVGESSIGVSWLARTVSSTTLPSAAQLGTIAAEDGWAK